MTRRKRRGCNEVFPLDFVILLDHNTFLPKHDVWRLSGVSVHGIRVAIDGNT